jgi:hypothetical protein
MIRNLGDGHGSHSLLPTTIHWYPVPDFLLEIYQGVCRRYARHQAPTLCRGEELTFHNGTSGVWLFKQQNQASSSIYLR